MVNLDARFAAAAARPVSNGIGNGSSMRTAPLSHSLTASFSETLLENLSRARNGQRPVSSIATNAARQPIATGQISVMHSPATVQPDSTAPVKQIPDGGAPVTQPPPSTPTSGAAADDAYWAQQPAAVQQLRNMQDFDQRKTVASQLAAEGYTIDVPIMVWGWDPSKTMAARQSYGYTWVPSALQAPVTAAPGITAPGMTSYDPSNPPAGSILV